MHGPQGDSSGAQEIPSVPNENNVLHPLLCIGAQQLTFDMARAIATTEWRLPSDISTTMKSLSWCGSKSAASECTWSGSSATKQELTARHSNLRLPVRLPRGVELHHGGFQTSHSSLKLSSQAAIVFSCRAHEA